MSSGSDGVYEGDAQVWAVRGRVLTLDVPRIMGIVNVTPDSFSDGGQYDSADRAARHAEELITDGADLIDIGGESTRPGADPVPREEEIRRIVPVIEQVSARTGVLVSVDTRHAEVAEAALAAGAHIVNDVSGLRDPAMGEVVAQAGAGLVLMHMRGTPATMQSLAIYDDLVSEVRSELEKSLDAARQAGVPDEKVVLDPGIGFAKTTDQNLRLIAKIGDLARLGRPILLGVSRKAFLGTLLDGAPPDQRDVATAAACVAGLSHGARIFRVHNVRVTREALAVAEAIDRSTD